jgi:glycyl-tRNA synthetase beta subunit
VIAPINGFFEKVFVMVENEAVRQNRLLLLKAIADLPSRIVDLTEIRDI